MKKPLILSAAINLKATAGKPRRFSIRAYSGGLLPVDGFPLPVVVDLSGLTAAGSIPVILDHDATTANTLGGTDRIVNDGRSLTLSGPVTGNSPQVVSVLAQADSGHQWQASIGAMVTDSIEIAVGEQVAVNGQTFTGPLILARRAVLRETSVLPMGADATTSVNLAARAARNLKGSAMPTIEEWAASKGIDLASLTPEVLAIVTTAYESEQTAPVEAAQVTPPPAAVAAAPAPVIAAGAKPMDIKATLAQHNKAVAENLTRQNAIMVKAAGHPMIAAKAISEDWGIHQTELEVMKATNIQASGARVTSFKNGDNKVNEDNAGLVLEAALSVRGGSTKTEKMYRPEILQAARSVYNGSLGLKDTIMIVARANGWNGASFNLDSSDCFRAAWGNERSVNLRAGFSTISLPGVLGNTAKKFLLEGYENVEETWRQVSAIGTVSDFKEITSYRMAVDGKFKKIGPAGKLQHGAMSEESYTNQAETYGLMLSITRRDLVNDDLGALTKIPKQLGRGAALAFNTVFWTEFLADSSTFFPTDLTKGNYMEGSGTVLSIASLTAAELMFLNQTDPYGEPMATVPQILLVPNALNTPASQFTRDTEVRDTTASTKYTTSNPHAGKFTPIRSSYLSNSTIPGYSTTAWYLMANPNDVAMIESVFLDGKQAPTIDQADADFSELGIQMRAYMDFGVNKQDHRAAVKSKGAA